MLDSEKLKQDTAKQWLSGMPVNRKLAHKYLNNCRPNGWLISQHGISLQG